MKCWPWSHHWENWITFQKGSIVRSETTIPIGTYESQRRICLLCGKVQLRTVSTL